MAKVITDNQHYSAIAEAIRAKNETDTLYKPSEMASAILEIQGGGADLNFEIVGGTAQPEKPKENTVWVNTDQEITGWSFSATKPTDPIDGTVYFFTGHGENAFNILSDNVLDVDPISCQQYIGTSWEHREAQVYINGSWNALWNGELFDHGNSFEEVTGGWTPCAKWGDYTPNMAESYIRDVIRVYKYTSDAGAAAYRTFNQIDIGDNTILEVVVDNIIASAVILILSNNANNPWNGRVAEQVLDRTGKFSIPLNNFQNQKLYVGVGEYSAGAYKYGADISLVALRR